MAQEDYTVTDQDGASHLAELNAIMAAIASNNSGATAPSVTYAHMWWVDTTSGWVKQRNAANSAWEKKFPIDKARVDVASAATLDLDANTVTSDYLRITGTTTVTAVTLAAGQRRIAVAGGAFQLTNSASLIVQGGSDYTTTAGDLLLFFGESGGVVRVYVLQTGGAAYVALTGNQTIAGVKTFSSRPVFPTPSMVRVNTANGYGSTNTAIRRFSNVVTNQGSDITYADSAANGASFTINADGMYSISYSDQFNTSSGFGISLNSNQLTSAITTITASHVVQIGRTVSSSNPDCVSASLYLVAGDVIRAHANLDASGVGPAAQFVIARTG